MHCRFFLACPTPAELPFLPVQQVRACGIPFFIQMRHSQNKLYEASKPLAWHYQRRKICSRTSKKWHCEIAAVVDMQLKEHTSTKWKEIKIKLPNGIYLPLHSAILLPNFPPVHLQWNSTHTYTGTSSTSSSFLDFGAWQGRCIKIIVWFKHSFHTLTVTVTLK